MSENNRQEHEHVAVPAMTEGVLPGVGRHPAPTDPASRLFGAIWPYLSIARPDHWFKNVFMLFGVVLAAFYHYPAFQPWSTDTIWRVALGFVAVCIIASSNYVINELLDAKTDRNHPTKCFRPIPSGQVNETIAYVQWLALAAVGLAIAAFLGLPFCLTALALFVMGLVYNIPPVRSKELPYLDVLSESVNNPLRLMLGWFTVGQVEIPPLSLLLSYWMVGAFFMATKRFSEYRGIDDKAAACAYRKSFKHYDEKRLLVSMFVYSTASALFLGVFIIRYHLELLISVPLIAGFFGYYMHVALKDDSSAQAPERLYRERGLMVYLVLCIVAFVALMFVHIPAMYELFNVKATVVPALWEISY